jgi:tetraprenyl-beta-curcumene synthase
MTRELLWGLPAVSRETLAWRVRAGAAPDAPLREDALDALGRKRGHIDGAALFWILPRRRNRRLLALLVAYEIIWDFLDNVNERGAASGLRNGRQLHRALSDGLDPSGRISEHYRYHPWRDDGGYLRALVELCRESCRSLPSYERIRDLVLQEATRSLVLAINHDPDPVRRDRSLQAWAQSELAARCDATWFELTGAASASLTVHALLALASEPGCRERAVAATHAVYGRWVSTVATMLDSYVDQAEDAASGDHSYIAHYRDEAAVERVCALVRQAAQQAQALNDGARHAVLLASMVALYLSKDSARVPPLRSSTRALAAAGGTLTRLLLPILRLWRIAYGQRSA